MKEKTVFRLATIHDVAALVALRAAFLAEVAGTNPADPSLRRALSRYFSKKVPAGEFVAYVATVNNRVIATSGLVYHQHAPSVNNLTGREAYVLNMYTLPPWRKKGIGSVLLKKLIAFARKNRCAQVTLYAKPNARPVYVRAGFVPMEHQMRLDLR